MPGIFLLQDDESLVEMSEQPYNSEAWLQELLARYPNLLAGDQMESRDPRRWLLVRREVGIPGAEDGGGRWSVDHLFLDQDAVPTLVEVKRSTDTRIRREVVGQMLDYAANAVVYWPVEQIRTRYEDGAQDVEAEFATLLGKDADVEEFWQDVKTNLQAGRIRMVFVADVIPRELRRVVEFLNEQMNPAEVLAVEVRQFVGEGMTALAPRLVGQTAKTEATKRTKGAGRVDLEGRLAFWSAFHAHVLKEAPDLKPTEPTDGPQLEFLVNTPNITLVAVADCNVSKSAARLEIRGENAVERGETLLRFIESNQNKLRKAYRFGVARRGNMPKALIAVTRDFELAEKTGWQASFAWLVAALKEMRETLLPAVPNGQSERAKALGTTRLSIDTANGLEPRCFKGYNFPKLCFSDPHESDPHEGWL